MKRVVALVFYFLAGTMMCSNLLSFLNLIISRGYSVTRFMKLPKENSRRSRWQCKRTKFSIFVRHFVRHMMIQKRKMINWNDHRMNKEHDWKSSFIASTFVSLLVSRFCKFVFDIEYCFHFLWLFGCYYKQEYFFVVPTGYILCQNCVIRVLIITRRMPLRPWSLHGRVCKTFEAMIII